RGDEPALDGGPVPRLEQAEDPAERAGRRGRGRRPRDRHHVARAPRRLSGSLPERARRVVARYAELRAGKAARNGQPALVLLDDAVPATACGQDMPPWWSVESKAVGGLAAGTAWRQE